MDNPRNLFPNKQVAFLTVESPYNRISLNDLKAEGSPFPKPICISDSPGQLYKADIGAIYGYQPDEAPVAHYCMPVEFLPRCGR